MKKLHYILLACSLTVASCSKDDDNLDKEIVGLGGDSWEKTAIDNWLYDNFTKPFNIDVKYRWDGTEVDISKNMVPPKVEQVQPLMSVVRNAWIDPYVDQAGDVFIKKYSPKQYVLVGSLQYNTNGTYTLGEAEGGNKVTLYNVNNFKPQERSVVQRVLKTIHHEFTHILNQNSSYPKEFPLVSPAGYTSDWNSSTNAAYLQTGFITQYAQAAPGEDFAEMVSIMLTQGRSGYETLLKTPDTKVELIRQKEAIVVTYFKQAWNINFSELQTKVQKAINTVAPGSLYPFLGLDKTFTILTIDPENTAGQSQEFLEALNFAKDSLYNFSEEHFVIDYIDLSFNSDGRLQMKIAIRETAGSDAGATNSASYYYSVDSNDSNETYGFELVSKSGNGTYFFDAFKPLAEYFSNATFELSYHYDDAVTVEYGKLVKAGDSNSFTFGSLN